MSIYISYSRKGVEAMRRQFFTIGEAAQQLSVSVQTIRRYEKLGKFPRSNRNRVNNRREYTEKDINRMLRILGRV